MDDLEVIEQEPRARVRVRDVLRTAAALQALILLAHLAGVMMYKVEDVEAIGWSILGFSAAIWCGAAMVLGGILLDVLIRWFFTPSTAKPVKPGHETWLDE
jgi:hypothetical protein